MLPCTRMVIFLADQTTAGDVIKNRGRSANLELTHFCLFESV